MTTLDLVKLCKNVFMPCGKFFSVLRDFKLYTYKQEVCFEKKCTFPSLFSLELAGIEHKVQAGMFVSQIFKSVYTSDYIV